MWMELAKVEREEKHRSEYSVVLQIVRMKSDPSVDGSGGSTVRIGGIREEMISRRKGNSLITQKKKISSKLTVHLLLFIFMR